MEQINIIELRSDTFTQPTPAMLDAMMSAQVGDDVFGEDPSVNMLEEKMASMFGMEAGLFCPSGTMTNQVAIKCHTQPGDEVICDALSHIFQYEGGGIAFNSGASVKLLQGDRGRVTAEMVEAAINPDDVHKPASTLVSLENTANRGGGACYNFADIEHIKKVCSDNNLGFHLDGARLFNALVAKRETPQQYGKAFDSISICLSKGLGAPVGSVLIGTKPFIKKARRIRKVWGGGMRQAGYMAAAGLYAVEHHIDRLAEDHQHAALVGEALQKKDWVSNILPVETNILIFGVAGKYSAASLAMALSELGIRCIAISATQVRMVFHLGVSAAMTEQVIAAVEQL